MNEIGMKGIDFVEYANPKGFAGAFGDMEKLFLGFGFSKLAKLPKKEVYYFKQNDIHFFLNNEADQFAREFSKSHGPSICSMAWRFENPEAAYNLAVKRGAKPAQGQYHYADGKVVPAVYGIGESLIYFVTDKECLNNYKKFGFETLENPVISQDKGFVAVDHLTNNVFKGTMAKWAEFYKNIFEFTEVRYFDIRGEKTGLTSFALKSPCGSFCIPINEGTERQSQINEYLEEYKGPGVQHLAFLTKNILSSLKSMEGTAIETLDIDDEYYADIFTKFPKVKEDHQEIKKRQVLVDGDDKGYLLQIFTKNLIGPIFIEIIQRENHYSFGEGNFGALFRSIERDQIKRGVIS